MPGENLHKLTKNELRELRRIVRRVYGQEQGLTPEQAAQCFDERECDKLIDSLLPDTVEKLKQRGIESNWVSKKRFFLPSRITDQFGKPLMREDRDD
jgi:hypothetical protein